MKAFFKRLGDWIMFLLTGGGKIAREGVDAEICDFSGQGRDRYGR